MCGLVAIFNSQPMAHIEGSRSAHYPTKQNALFKDMMLASAVRGVDGTGIYQVDHTHQIWLDKMAEPSGKAMSDPRMQGMSDFVDQSAITVGHVRAATVGDVVEENCHPFEAFREDGSFIVGVHNGTLYGWDNDPDVPFSVDSEWALNKIAQDGPSALDEFYGAFTFIWVDSDKPGKVFIARNNERPLHMVRSKDGRSLYAASEAGMLRWLVDKHNLLADEEVLSLDTNAVVCIDTNERVLAADKVFDFMDGVSYQSYYSYHSALPAPTKKDKNKEEEHNPAKKSLVEKVKECLRLARWDVLEEDRAPFVMGPVGDTWNKADGDWYKVEGVDGAEIARAHSEGVYGTIVQYEAVAYDDLQGCVVGEIVTPSQLNMPVAYVHDVQEDAASSMIDQKVPSVIIGARIFGDETEYVVAPMNERGLKALAV